MPQSTPIYRADTLACPLNAGKLMKVRRLVEHLRHIAGREAQQQWQGFFRRRWTGFDTIAQQGWSRPWMAEGHLNARFSQMVMHQVGGALTGHLGQVKNTYAQMVSGSSLPPVIRHQLHSLNRRGLWCSTGPVTVQQILGPADVQALATVRPVLPAEVESGLTAQQQLKHRLQTKFKRPAEGSALSPGAELPMLTTPKITKKPPKKASNKPIAVVISPTVMHWARVILRQALRRHRRPNFSRFQFQLDQRASWVQRAHTAKHADWLMLSMGDGTPWIALPLEAHAAFQSRNDAAGLWQVLSGRHADPAAPNPATGASFLADLQAAEAKAAKRLNPHPSRFRVPNTVRLLLDADGKGLRIGVLTDMAASFAHQTATYCPEKPGKVLCLDLGLSTLLATDDGELHGRGWMEKLLVLDRRLTGIARHRQRLGLKVSGSARYRATVQQLRGWLKTEIHRILNKLVARKRPEVIAIEALDFRSPRLSRRLNRLIQNFGQGVLTEKLQALEEQFGIVTERRFAAYSSQECHRCHYIDPRNRVSQLQFHCQFCGLQQHADIQAARTLRDRRSVADSGSSAWSRQAFLLERTRAFQARHTRPRGGPADPRYTNRYFPDWKTVVRLPDGGSTDPIRSSRASASIHLQ